MEEMEQTERMEQTEPMERMEQREPTEKGQLGQGHLPPSPVNH
ncbi:hypothetical protein [Streptomyces sp. NPDC052015]